MARTLGTLPKPREELFLVTGPYDTAEEVLTMCSGLPDLSAVRIDDTGYRDYRPMLRVINERDGRQYGRTAVVTMTVLDGDQDGRALMTLRSASVPSQPNVWGMLTGCFEEPLADFRAKELLTPALRSLPLFGEQTPYQHSFDVLHPNSWLRLPNTRRFRQLLEADDPLQAAREISDLTSAEALSAIVVSPLVSSKFGKFELRDEIATGKVKLIFAAEAFRTGIAFNNATTAGNEFELLMMLSMYIVVRGAEHITHDKLNQGANSDFLWGTQADVAETIRTRDLSLLLPDNRLAEVCVRGECVRNGLLALDRLRRIRSEKPNLLRSLIEAA